MRKRNLTCYRLNYRKDKMKKLIFEVLQEYKIYFVYGSILYFFLCVIGDILMMGIFPPQLNFMIIPVVLINFILYYFILKGVLTYYMSHIYEYNQGQHGQRRFEDRDKLIETYNLVPAYGNFDDVEPGVVIAWEKTNNHLMNKLNEKYRLDKKLNFLKRKMIHSHIIILNFMTFMNIILLVYM